LLAEKAVAIPKRKEDLGDNLLHTRFVESHRLCANDGRVDEIEPQRISSVLINDFTRIWEVLETLGHLFAIRSQDETVDDNVPEWGDAKKLISQDCQGVEPAAGLV